MAFEIPQTLLDPRDPTNWEAPQENDPSAEFAKIAASYGLEPLNRAQTPTRADIASGELPVIPRAQPAGQADQAPVQRAQSAQSPDLGTVRQQFVDEFQKKPGLLRKVMASAQAEVGGQGPLAIQAYVESIMNRAVSRKMSLEATISDSHYYPSETIGRLNRPVSTSEQERLFPYIHNALTGSNVSNFATGNASGKVGVGTQTLAAGGERFGVEDPDQGWHTKLGLSGPVGDRGATGATSDAELEKAAGPVYIQPVDRSTLKPITGKNDLSADDVANIARAQADDFAAAMDKAGTPLTVGEYKAHLSSFYVAAQKMNIGIPPERMPIEQVDKMSALHDGLKIIDDIAEKQAILKTKYPGWVPGFNVSGPITHTDEYKNYQTAVQIGSAQLARGVGGQTGVLTDNDIKIIRDALPNEHDTPTQARIKADIMKKQSIDMMAGKSEYLKAAHYDTSEFEPKIAKSSYDFENSPSQLAIRDAKVKQAELDTQQKAAKYQANVDRANRIARPTPLLPPSQQPNSATTPGPNPAVTPVPGQAQTQRTPGYPLEGESLIPDQKPNQQPFAGI